MQNARHMTTAEQTLEKFYLPFPIFVMLPIVGIFHALAGCLRMDSLIAQLPLRVPVWGESVAALAVVSRGACMDGVLGGPPGLTICI